MSENNDFLKKNFRAIYGTPAWEAYQMLFRTVASLGLIYNYTFNVYYEKDLVDDIELEEDPYECPCCIDSDRDYPSSMTIRIISEMSKHNVHEMKEWEEYEVEL